MKTLPMTLLLLTLAHGLVDAYAGTLQPLWPDLQRGLRLDDGAFQWIFLLWNLTTSVSQLGFGYWGDRYQGRWLLWAGPLLAIVCLSMIGLVSSVVGVSLLLIVGGLGIAAFHPEAAALAGSCAPEQRGRAMSVFSVGGYLGQALGPTYSGVLTTNFGLKGLAWGLTWGLGALGLLAWGLRGAPAAVDNHPTRGGRAVPLAELLRGKGVTVALLLGIGVWRVLPAAGVPVALAYLLKARGASNEQIGLPQTVYLAAIGLGSLGCAVLVRRARERQALRVLPLLVAPLLLVCPWVGTGGLLVALGVGGALLGATMPITVSFGQRLLPDGQRVASSITMGVTWGVGGALVAATMTICNHLRRPEFAFVVFAAGAVLSSLMCYWLPEPETRRHDPNRDVLPQELTVEG